jgi:hypothetical protein
MGGRIPASIAASVWYEVPDSTFVIAHTASNLQERRCGEMFGRRWQLEEGREMQFFSRKSEHHCSFPPPFNFAKRERRKIKKRTCVDSG